MADNLAEKFWDMWLVGLGSMSWSQEQLENMVQKYLEQKKNTREETARVIEDLMGQVKKNQMQMQTMMQDAVKAALENVEFPNFDYLNMSRKIDDLSRKVDDLQ